MKYCSNQNGFIFNEALIKRHFSNGNDETNNASIIKKYKEGKIFVREPKILSVEDNVIVQSVNLFYLSELGCKADLAKDGFEAIELFQNGYDLILLDIRLCGRNGRHKSGIEVVKEIRRFERETGIKPNIIIALTALGNTILDMCRKAGCNDFYVKPLLIEPLGKVLQHWLPHLINKSFSKNVSVRLNPPLQRVKH